MRLSVVIQQCTHITARIKTTGTKQRPRRQSSARASPYANEGTEMVSRHRPKWGVCVRVVFAQVPLFLFHGVPQPLAVEGYQRACPRFQLFWLSRQGWACRLSGDDGPRPRLDLSSLRLPQCTVTMADSTGNAPRRLRVGHALGVRHTRGSPLRD